MPVSRKETGQEGLERRNLWAAAGVRSLLSDTRNSNPLTLPYILIFECLLFVVIVIILCYFFCIASATCQPASVRSLLSDTRKSNPPLTSKFLDYLYAYSFFYWFSFITHYFDCLYVYSQGLRPDALHLLIIWMFIAFEASSYQKYPKVLDFLYAYSFFLLLLPKVSKSVQGSTLVFYC